MMDTAKGMVFWDDMISTAIASFGGNRISLHSNPPNQSLTASSREEHRRNPSDWDLADRAKSEEDLRAMQTRREVLYPTSKEFCDRQERGLTRPEAS